LRTTTRSSSFVGDKKFGGAGAAYDSPDSVAERSSPPRQSWLSAHSTPALRSLVEIRVAVGPPSLIRYNNLPAVDSRDLAYRWRNPMTAPAERMRIMRQRRRARGLRELRLVVADARSRAVRRRVAKQVAGLDPDRERDALRWIESVSEFDADATR
jgi:hypothetical protein